MHGNATHGLSKHPLYTTWCGMMTRCYKSTHAAYKRYGGRGITVCQRWRDSPQNFIDDMGPKPSPQHTIERINNNLGYSPENCCWETIVKQSLNTRRARPMTFNGETKTRRQWAFSLGMPYTTFLAHIYRHARTLPEIIAIAKEGNVRQKSKKAESLCV